MIQALQRHDGKEEAVEEAYITMTDQGVGPDGVTARICVPSALSTPMQVQMAVREATVAVNKPEGGYKRIQRTFKYTASAEGKEFLANLYIVRTPTEKTAMHVLELRL